MFLFVVRSAPVGYAAEHLTLLFSSLFPVIAVLNIIPFSGLSMPTSNQSTFYHTIQFKIRLPQCRQHPSANEQPTHERIQTPPVRSHYVQKYSPVRGHHLLVLPFICTFLTRAKDMLASSLMASSNAASIAFS